MPTTIPMAHHRARAARAAIYVNNSGTSRFAAPGYRAWDELQSVLNSDDFRTVATFSAIGLLAGLLAILSGVQGVWM